MKMKNELKEWEREKKLVPVMIRKHCKGRHKAARKEQDVAGKEVCAECRELTEYALLRLEKCPFKENKQFCSFCKIHCYKPEMREKVKAVMKYSGARMLFTHPVFAISHVAQLIKHKRRLKGEDKAK